jgi:putative tricarboxylic transport membrane protein
MTARPLARMAQVLAVLVLPTTVVAQDAATPTLGTLTIVAPAAPGGGWDQLAREMQRHIEQQQLADNVVVENVPGAAGTIGLAQFANRRRGDREALLVTGLVMLGAILWNQSPVSIGQTTPIARLTAEFEIVAVPSASPHRDLQSLVGAVRANPASVSWAGGSAGGTDHILAGLIVQAAGADPRRTNYIAFAGGGEAVTALLGGQVTAGISGYSEFAPHIESGRLRAVAISAPNRVTGLDVPTLIEQGVDVELANWRAVVAPAALRGPDREALSAVVERMARSDSWRATLTRLGWTDAYLPGAAFEHFLAGERARVADIVSRLSGSTAETAAAQAGEWLFPAAVLGASAVVLSLLFGGRGVSKSERRVNRSAMARLVLGLVLFLASMTVAGFIAAGTLLFVCTASAFGSRRWRRDALVGLTLCAVVYSLFTYGLGVRLP